MKTATRLLIAFAFLAFAHCSWAGSGAPVFLHFFDWFKTESWQETKFVDKFDWEKIGISGSDRSSEQFYYKQFAYMRSLGIDAIAWEYGGDAKAPSDAAIKALKRSGLKIAPFYDWEISEKQRSIQQRPALPNLSAPGSIRPNDETVATMKSDWSAFYLKVPSELLAKDKLGRYVMFVFGYGFDDTNPDPAKWEKFAVDMEASVAQMTGGQTTFYWTSTNSVFEQYLFLHHRDSFVPFQFVLDTPQTQFGHDSVTWNFGFDNLGVQKLYGMQRVVRLDRRYLEEMGWLSKATDPSLVFIYSWNEPFESSMLMPTEAWGDTKARLAKSFIALMKSNRDASLPKTLLIVDDPSAYWTTRKGDWHLLILNELLLYPFRRFAPQADVRMPSEITSAMLDRYPYIIDATSQKSLSLSKLIRERMDSHRVMVFDPLAANTGSELVSRFGKLGSSPNVNREVPISGTDGTLFVRDDVNEITPCASCKIAMSVQLPSSRGRSTPVVVQSGNDVLVNAYTSDEGVLDKAFEAFYGRPMNTSIMYGEGMASQRLEIDGKTKSVTYNRLERKSVNGRWQIPADIDWNRLPAEVSPKDFDFVFGICQSDINGRCKNN